MRWHGLLALACVLAGATITAAQEKPAMPQGAVARLGVSRLRVPHMILDSAFSPDQRTFVVVIHTQDPNVFLFDVATGLERKRLDIREARRVAMARHKPLMAVITEQRIELWDLAGEKCLWHRRRPLEAFYAQAIAISPDGTQVVVASSRAGKPGGAILLRWDAPSGKELPSLYASNHLIQSVQFSDDSSKLVFVSYPRYGGPGEKQEIIAPGEIIAWDAKTGKKIADLENRHGSIACSPDATKLARSTQNGQAIEIVAFDGGKPIAEIRVDRSRFAFTPDGKHLITHMGWNDTLIRLWDIAGNREVRTLEGTAGIPTSPPRFTPDGRLLAIELTEAQPYYSVQFWDLATGKHFRFATGHSGQVNGLAYSPDGRWLATFSKDTLLICDPKTGDELRRWITHETQIEQIAFSPDGALLASASVDGAIGLWDPTTAKLRRRLTAKGAVKSVAFSRDGRALLAVCQGQWMQSWDVVTGIVQSSFMGREPMTFPLLSPTGSILAHHILNDKERGERGPRVFLLNPLTGKALPTIDLERRQSGDEFGLVRTVVSAVVFSADSKLLATCDSLETSKNRRRVFDHTIRIWETATRREIMRLTDNPIDSRFLAISPDGRMVAHLVQGQDSLKQSLIVRDISTAQNTRDWTKESRQIGGHHGHITCLAFSPDSKFLATGGSDQVVYVWRVEDFFKRPNLPEVKGDVAALWPRLADADAGKAYQAIAQLERKPKEAVALLRTHLKPVPMADEKVIAQHLRDLSSANFAIRQQANVNLEKVGEHAAQLLQEALKQPPTLEAKRRLETLLEKLDRPLEEPGQIRVYRCLVLLERIGTPEARKLLLELSKGAPAAWLTTEARYSLKRFQGR